MTTPTTADMFERFASLILAERLRMAMGTARADQEDVAFLDQLDADIEAARATIARLEEERRNLALKLQQVDEELAVDGHYNTVEKAILVRAQANRADAAERRVEAVTAVVDAAVDWRVRQSIRAAKRLGVAVDAYSATLKSEGESRD